jgi:uncharacterized protein YjbJ (UPF0337 family)
MKAKTLTEHGIEQSKRGRKNIVRGRVEDAVGGITGNAALQLKGKIKQAKGKAQDAVGTIERKIERLIDRSS